MKKRFLALTLKQKKKVYILTICVSVVLFFLIPTAPLFLIFWGLAIAATIKERKIIKDENSKETDNICKEPEHVPDPTEIESNGIVSPAPSPDVIANVEIAEEPEDMTNTSDNTEKASTTPVPELYVAFKTEWVEAEPVGELSHLDFGKPAGKLGCFLNYEPRTLYPPSERQLNYLKDLGVVIPEGITNIDASCMISRATGEDSLESPSASTIALASGFNLQYSAFIGEDDLFRGIVFREDDRDRAALYVYGVARAMRGLSFGNMLEDPEVDRYYFIADKIVADPALLRSLKDRAPEDYKKPYRGTAVYKAVIANLKEN